MTLIMLCVLMIIFLICTIAWDLVSLFAHIEGKEKESDRKLIVSYIFLTLTIITIVFLCWGMNHFENLPYEYSTEPYSIEHITSLKDNSEVNGQFHGSRYCVRGYINEVQYYLYMVQHSDGGKVQNKIPVNGSTIYEVDGDYRIEWYHKTKKWLGMTNEENFWKVYVPINSITDQYSIDLE